MKLNRLAIALIAITLTSLSTNAEPNYTYVLQPGQAYVNTTNKPQLIKVESQDEQISLEKARDTLYKTTNTLNDVVNNVRAITTMFDYSSNY